MGKYGRRIGNDIVSDAGHGPVGLDILCPDGIGFMLQSHKDLFNRFPSAAIQSLQHPVQCPMEIHSRWSGSIKEFAGVSKALPELFGSFFLEHRSKLLGSQQHSIGSGGSDGRSSPDDHVPDGKFYFVIIMTDESGVLGGQYPLVDQM